MPHRARFLLERYNIQREYHSVRLQALDWSRVAIAAVAGLVHAPLATLTS
jgi:hypothetical protein